MGFMIESWPTVLGIDCAGVIDAVGENTSNFKDWMLSSDPRGSGRA